MGNWVTAVLVKAKSAILGQFAPQVGNWATAVLAKAKSAINVNIKTVLRIMRISLGESSKKLYYIVSIQKI